jgi:hypothetical protein
VEALQMVNIPIDPRQFVPRGFQIRHVPGRNAVKKVLVARRLKAPEEFAIVSITPFPPGQVPFKNVAEILQEFLVHVQVGFRDIQACPLGAAYVRFSHVRDRDHLIRESLSPFGDVHLSFCKHNEGVNWRQATLNRECWLLLVGPPLDYRFTEDLNATFSDIGKLLLWEKDEGHLGKIIANVRVTDLEDIPKSVRFTDGDRPDSESWTFSIEILQEDMLGAGPPDED